MKSEVTEEFLDAFKRLPHRIKRVAKKNYRLWKRSPEHPSLEFKRVGKRSPVYSVRVGIGWRALGLKDKDLITWFWIGPHAEYDRLIARQ